MAKKRLLDDNNFMCRMNDLGFSLEEISELLSIEREPRLQRLETSSDSRRRNLRISTTRSDLFSE